MIGICLICGDATASVGRVTLAGRSILALCPTCSKRLRRASEMTYAQLEHARDEAHIHLAVIATALHPSKALSPVVSRYRNAARKAPLSVRGQ